MQKGLIYDSQSALFGMRNVIGYSNGKVAVKEMPWKVAKDCIEKHHYSHKIARNSYINLGVFLENGGG